MTDTITTTTTPAETTSTTEKAKQTRGDIDKAILADIKLGGDIATAALDSNHTAKLADEEITGATAKQLQAQVTVARDLAGKVVSAKKAKESAGLAEETARQALLLILRDFQQRAKRVYDTGDPQRAAYGINKPNFGHNRDQFEQDVENIIKLATADSLPGLKPEKLTAAREALEAWKKAYEAQNRAVEEQGRLLGELKAAVFEINAARHQIQLAADTAWPSTDKASAPCRRAFKLPVNKPLAK